MAGGVGLGDEGDDAVDVDVLADEVFDHADLVAVADFGFDRHAGDGRGDRVDVVGGLDEGDVALADHVHDVVGRGDAVGEDDSGDGMRAFIGVAQDGHDEFVAVAAGDDEGAGFDVVFGVAGGHGADLDAGDAAALVFGSGDEGAADFLVNLVEGRLAQFGVVGHDAEQGQAEALEAAGAVFADEVHFVGHDLVEDRADDFDAVFFKEGEVEGDLVDGFADAAGADDDDFAVEHFGDGGVGEVEDAADSGVAGAFDDDEVLFPGRFVEGGLDFAGEFGVVAAGEVAAGEVGLDGDGAHRAQGGADFVGLVDEHGVFVDLEAFDLDEALADGLDVADVVEAFFERREESDGRGGLAVVHACGGNENPGRDVVFQGQARFRIRCGVRCGICHESQPVRRESGAQLTPVEAKNGRNFFARLFISLMPRPMPRATSVVQIKDGLKRLAAI